jgi:hypothetical protein
MLDPNERYWRELFDPEFPAWGGFQRVMMRVAKDEGLPLAAVLGSPLCRQMLAARTVEGSC